MAVYLSFIKRYFSDLPGYVFYVLYKLRININKYYTTCLARMALKFKGIQLGKNCVFFGRPVFVRIPRSTIKIGDHCTFRSDKISNLVGVNRRCIISTHGINATIIVGQHCGFSGVTIGAKEKVVIGDHVLVGANVIISDFDWHNLSSLDRRAACTVTKPVIIENNVFIGVNAVIWKGVRIGENSIIGANSVVTRDIPSNCIAGGNPARVIKHLT